MSESDISLQRLCAALPHFTEGVLNYLSGSEAASFLAALNILGDKEWKRTRDQFVSFLRDVPEHSPWIEGLMSKGHKVFFVGRDVTIWKKRLEDPVGYWKEHSDPWNEEPLKVWIAVRVVTDMFKKPSTSHGLRNRYYHSYGTDVNGNIFTKILKQRLGRHILRRNILPVSGDVQPTQSVAWRRSTKPNNIRVVWADFPDGSEQSTPHVRICPIQGNSRRTNDAMNGNHYRQNHSCLLLPPGAVCEISPIRKLCTFMPYIDLGDGKLQECEVIDPLNRGSVKNKFALLIEFSCYGAQDDPTRPLGLNVCRTLQGILL